MKSLNLEYQHYIKEAVEDHQISGQLIDTYLSTTPFEDRLDTLYIPKVFEPEAIAQFKALVRTTSHIFEKIIAHYQQDAHYRTLFPFSPELEALICLPSGYSCSLPMARYDIFYNEETRDFKFCEINTDGTSAMNEVRILNASLKKNLAQREIMDRHAFKGFVLFDAWVARMMALYQEYPRKKANPTVAIVDFIRDASLNSQAEFAEFQRHFEDAGYHTLICDVREFTYEGGVLWAKNGETVDVIYRRAVTSDLLAHYKEITPFLDAIRQDAVCLFGPIATQVIHNKWLFYLLHRPETKAILTPAEGAFVAEHFPTTLPLTPQTMADLYPQDHKDHWIIKPMDSYCSRGVYAGIDQDQDTWEELLRSCQNKDYIIQEYCHPYRSPNIDFSDAHPVLKPYANMTGLYVFGGEFAGVYARLSDGGIISSQYNEKVAPVLMLVK